MRLDSTILIMLVIQIWRVVPGAKVDIDSGVWGFTDEHAIYALRLPKVARVFNAV